MRYLLYATAVLLAGYLLTGLTEVRPGERAVVRRFGKIVATPGPGLWVGLPWGMDRVDRVGVDQLRHLPIGYQPGEDESDQTPAGQLLTGDHNLVNVQVVLDYSVRPHDGAVQDYLVQADRAEALLTRAAEAALAEWIAGRTVDDVLINGKAVLPGALVDNVQERIEPYRLGIEVQAASVSYLMPPDQVKQAFDRVTSAQAAIRTSELGAQETANRRLHDAEAEAFQRRQSAEAYRTKRLLMARAAAAGFEKDLRQYRQLRQDKPDFLASLWWKEMGKLFQRMKETGRIEILDHDLGGDELDITLFLPQKQK